MKYSFSTNKLITRVMYAISIFVMMVVFDMMAPSVLKIQDQQVVFSALSRYQKIFLISYSVYAFVFKAMMFYFMMNLIYYAVKRKAVRRKSMVFVNIQTTIFMAIHLIGVYFML